MCRGGLYIDSANGSYITGGGIRREKKRGSWRARKKVKGNGKRETRRRGRKAEGLKSINFKSQSRRLTVITLVAGTFASRICHQRRQRDLHSSSQCCWVHGERKSQGRTQKKTKGSQGARDAAKEIDVIRFSNSR